MKSWKFQQVMESIESFTDDQLRELFRYTCDEILRRFTRYLTEDEEQEAENAVYPLQDQFEAFLKCTSWREIARERAKLLSAAVPPSAPDEPAKSLGQRVKIQRAQRNE